MTDEDRQFIESMKLYSAQFRNVANDLSKSWEKPMARMYEFFTTIDATEDPNVEINNNFTDIMENDVNAVTRSRRRDIDQSSKNKNKEAERAINRIKEKLNGFHNGNLMGIEGHVNVLINEATDSENLALIYPGWSPYY